MTRAVGDALNMIDASNACALSFGAPLPVVLGEEEAKAEYMAKVLDVVLIALGELDFDEWAGASNGA